jgi:hypothetical protein
MEQAEIQANEVQVLQQRLPARGYEAFYSPAGNR